MGAAAAHVAAARPTRRQDRDRHARNARAREPRGGKLERRHEAAAICKASRSYIAYERAIDHGLPIATGVIEGACRYLVKDRMDAAARAGRSTAPRPSFASARCAPAATSTPTGPST